jgi:hypothetical protein
MCCNICPDNIFANSRTVKLTILAKYEIVSKKINAGRPIAGIPLGTNIFKKFHL